MWHFPLLATADKRPGSVGRCDRGPEHGVRAAGRQVRAVDQHRRARSHQCGRIHWRGVDVALLGLPGGHVGTSKSAAAVARTGLCVFVHIEFFGVQHYVADYAVNRWIHVSRTSR